MLQSRIFPIVGKCHLSVLKPTLSVVAVVFCLRPESLPQSNTTVIVGAVCGALVLLIVITVGTCFVMRLLHNRHDYEG